MKKMMVTLFTLLPLTLGASDLIIKKGADKVGLALDEIKVILFSKASQK